MWQPALAATLLLLSQVSAGVVGDVRRVARRGVEVEESMRRSVEKIVEPVERRQNPPKMNVTQWDEQTMAACTSALEMLKGQASNDAGMAVCYNLPFLDSTTGVFQADLRLFTISTPQKSFAGIPSQNISVGLSYVGATVSPVNASAIGRREEGHSLISWPRHEMEKRQNSAAPVPQMAQAYAFVGQINKDLLSTNMDSAALETLLVPTVTLTGTDSNGLQVKANLNPGEATFVSGQFAQPIIATKAQVQAPIQTLVVQSGAPFVVPGLHILIFPIGGVITGIWAILFIGTIAYGTYGRMQFRESYRRRSARADKGTVARI